MEKIKDGHSSFLISVIKGTLVAVCLSLAGVLIFAFLLRFIAIPDSAITPINQVIKGISVLFGCFFALKKFKEMGFVSGFVIGISHALLSFIAFSVLAGQFEFSKTLINDLLFGGIIGAISGIIAVNFVAKKK